jgi:hypothetical protein
VQGGSGGDNWPSNMSLGFSVSEGNSKDCCSHTNLIPKMATVRRV